MIVSNGPQCKLCRREGAKLMLKGNRCYLDKCAMERRDYAPGQHGAVQRRKKSSSGFAEQLREKQKIKRMYGLREQQFRNTFKKAVRMPGVTGENFLRILELRLDNIVFRMGFAPSRNAARQLVKHGHFLVNGKKVDIPSFQLRAGDVVSIKERSRKVEVVHAALSNQGRGVSIDWIQVDKVKLSGTVAAVPTRDQIPTPVNELLVVELYSK
ncbi:MAG: 30S ribosomal protein S4 [Candidatus Raymondbacteria bacterium RifOxyA12_full_50_37]|uniref:Small ribosomal subunit protein uS4 n=1 Tax=Candidatus Raymondbacteria bacterium RIFOXYD12_FULL_49_13 TaxID=1817890 RepID=A0A1F7FD72_UNCRA|nr:MAG: 30S ribosomal protein S4 [Candidatus Raymondbacteria bacterium RifOxyA12_full_50_37]OGJ94078.1 MAG: 30S ribosomal protein S4 [Candidatus Raymondbacteria bacterium RIFOXYA2_FULL_49_16]OGJ96833.1 MAG: 30S ribosomal protein S4 [Candidatus Raymondbacteria bacterium RifOxyC12_full_50_8]OGJ96903.1 MAG: 30S ribosomal protein S4 [Candidatus Raymondbacteria bacterium RIFOXYC2_FULL_50_21]OGK01507.1 MAG: 30S ribosomal protein S4 [Candidatus Raymondbacteria bacterium RifOxyB12_full_50_8]OGK04629.1